MVKKGEKTNQRDDYVYGVVSASNVSEITVRYDARTGKIELLGADPGSTKVVRSYKRVSGKDDKVVSSVPQEGGAPFDPDDALRSFDCVVAMDTNKRTIAGKECAVCFSYYVPVNFTQHRGDIPYTPLAAYLIVGVGKGVNPERIGWHLTLKNNLPAYNESAHGKLALVTDSELGLHPDINARKIGYYADHMLPDGAALVYASDKETSTIGGAMLKACHNAATKVLEEMRKRKDHLGNFKINGDANFEKYVQIEFQIG
jgi:hypothetical protein